MATDPGALFSQKDSEYSNAIGSSSRHASMEMRAPHVPLVAHGQLRLMLRPSQARQELQQGQAMLGFQRIRQLSALAPTIIIKPMDVAHMIHTVMPHRQYVASGWGRMEGCTPTKSIAGVSSHSGLLRTYVDLPEHGSGNSAMGYHLETLKRTAVTTELALGSSALVSDNAMPDWFDQDSTHKVHVDAGSGGASMKKSYSMDCLRLAAPSSLVSSSSSLLLSVDEGLERASNGYLSDGPHGRVVQERKKGVPWNEEEHRLFLVGLEKLGKGDWRGISRSYVKTRTPTQVASHAQKFFLRQSRMGKKKRRSSLFDMVPICENGVRVSEPLSSGQGASTSLSLNMSRHESSERAAIDLNSTEEDDKVDVSSASGASARPFPVVLMEQPSHGHHCSPLDLELGMSLSTPSIGT